MAGRPTVIVHGWSDSSESFERLATEIQNRLGSDVSSINLTDYESMDDQVTFLDIRRAMDRAWRQHGLPTTPRSVNVVVHSTGGLVIRDWMTAMFAPEKNPVRNLVMLAPANFGSPLAHKGRSFIGRVAKGEGWDRETGEEILKGLELASPFTWDLALRDRFGSKNYYGRQRTLCTVLVGNTGYDGISSIANEEGSDGTVRVSTASMESALLTVDLTSGRRSLVGNPKKSKGRTAFGVVDGENHSTIAAKQGGPRNPETLDLIIEALTVTDDGFKSLRKRLDEMTQQALERAVEAEEESKLGYQNTVVRVRNDQGRPVDDYLLEFDIDDADTSDFIEFFQREVIRKVHVYGGDASYRSIYVDTSTLVEKIDRGGEAMGVTFAAYPDFDETGSVGYRSDATSQLEIPRKQLKGLFAPNRTLLVDVRVQRLLAEDIFRVKEFEG